MSFSSSIDLPPCLHNIDLKIFAITQFFFSICHHYCIGGYPGQAPPIGGYPAPGGYPQQPPPAGGYGQPPPTGGYGQPPPTGGYGQPPPQQGYQQPPAG